MRFSYQISVACIAAVSAATHDPKYDFLKELKNHWSDDKEVDR